MKKKIKLLDLFCGAGGAAMGYSRAGFDITGVDIKFQKNYPFKFIQGDAINVLLDQGNKFDIIHASPPCQNYSRAGKQIKTMYGKKYPDLYDITKSILLEIGKPYVIENVPGSPLQKDIILYGYMFNLKVIRERWFELGGGASSY